MSQDTPEVTAARIEAERARARLMDSAHDLQSRLSPRTLAQNAWEGAKVKGADMAETAVDAVRERPVAVGGVAAAIALFLARKPLKSLAGKLMGSDSTEGDVTVSASEITNMETANGYTTSELFVADPVRQPKRERAERAHRAGAAEGAGRL